MGRKNQAYEYLINAIIENELPPGTLIREMELSEKLNMSRSPIREALRQLETEGVVISYPSRGTIVTPITVSDVEEIYELRSMFELWALEQGFHRFTYDELEALLNDFTDAYQNRDWKALHKTDLQFHQSIINKSGSKRLCNFVNTLNVQIERIRRYGAKDVSRMDISFAEHTEVIRAIQSNDLEASKKTLKKHLRSVSNSAIETARMIDISSHLISQ